MRAVLGSRTRRLAALALVVALAAALAVLVWPRSSAAVAIQELTITGAAAPWDDAPVRLDATLYLPERTPAPAVIVAHGFGGSKDSVAAQAQRLATEGFVVLAYSARGFGKSTGTISLDSLHAEVPDAAALVDYLAARPEVTTDGPDDPRVGVTGGSYGGALALMLAGTDPRVDAVVPVITWNDLQQALFPNALDDGRPAGTPAAVAAGGDGVFKKYWAAALISSVVGGTDLAPDGAVGSTPGSTGRSGGPTGADPGCGRLRVAVCAAYAQAAATGRITEQMAELLADSSPAAVTDDITAPTLLVQGELDTLFGLDQADANARQIAANGTTVAVDWYRGGHDGGAPDEVTQQRITEWLRYYLAGVGDEPATTFRYSVDGGFTDRGRPRTRVLAVDGYPGLPGSADVRRRAIELSGDEQVVLNPPGGSPAAISSLPGLGQVAGALTGALTAGPPGQTATFSSSPLSDLTVVTGSARVTLTVAAVPTATVGDTAAPGTPSGEDRPVLFASIGAAADNGTVTVGGNAVSPVRLPPLPSDGSPLQITVDLPAVSLQLAAGDRLVVRLTTTDQAYAGPTDPAAYRIAGVSTVLVPVAGGVRVSAGEVPVGMLIALAALVLIGAGGLVMAGRKRRTTGGVRQEPSGSAEPAASGAAADVPVPPLVIRNLVKSYPGGVTAVQDVSFAVRAGSVFGLLGPNGAGKTTTLRMVMGLIGPTAGSIEVFGHPVSAGAPILSRIGSFVEGSGFLPHLSGQTNLQLYWRATGRPAADAHLDEALSIAGLGDAVHRKVRTYSQGMRQRLAIAQAMLGLPDLLLLDEPTNGLDPPQIHAMREVLRRYAATGRTVVVSSHLLSEVEQTCSDVVVIHRGRTIAAGRVADLVASSGEMTFGVDDPEVAARLLTGIDGVLDVQVEADLVQADLGEVAASQAVATLVAAGVEVSSAAPRNRLEDVFLDLVGAAADGSADSAAAEGDS